MCRSVSAPSWLPSNRAWKTSPGGWHIHRHVRYSWKYSGTLEAQREEEFDTRAGSILLLMCACILLPCSFPRCPVVGETAVVAAPAFPIPEIRKRRRNPTGEMLLLNRDLVCLLNRDPMVLFSTFWYFLVLFGALLFRTALPFLERHSRFWDKWLGLRVKLSPKWDRGSGRVNTALYFSLRTSGGKTFHCECMASDSNINTWL